MMKTTMNHRNDNDPFPATDVRFDHQYIYKCMANSLLSILILYNKDSKTTLMSHVAVEKIVASFPLDDFHSIVPRQDLPH